MPIQIEASDSTRKSIDVTVTPSATGIAVAGSVRWFDVLYTIPPVTIPCIYTDDATHRVALCASPPRLVLVEDDAAPADEVCYLALWRFTSPTDTCASVTITVPSRVLVIPEVLDDEGNPLPPAPLPTPTVRAVSSTPVLPAASTDRTESRKLRRRIRDLRQQAKALKAAGTTYAAMTAAQRLVINELVALTGEAAPLAVP